MTALTLELYAQILARLALGRRDTVEQVLAEVGVTPEDLLRDEPALRAQLREAWPRRKGVAAMKFAAAIGEELDKEPLLAAALRPGAAQGPETTSRSASAADTRAPHVPSFLQAPERIAPAPPAPLRPTGEVGRMPSGAGLAETSDVDMRTIIASVMSGSVPFSGKRSALVSAERGQAPTRVATGTVGMDYRAVVAAVDKPGSLPFPEAAATAAPADGGASEASQLALETYAAISGSLARGEPREHVLARHGVTAQQWAQQSQAWSDRCQLEPELFARFRALVRG